ncbi:MAG: holo-ACP synthase [Deltaproteobacteria bacterium]|nr:holo-ACP synthase [Deltaproteobacteria bacterium]
MKSDLEKLLYNSSLALSGTSFGIGVDVEILEGWKDRLQNQDFLKANFSPQEIEYCQTTHHPQQSLLGRWCAKEAVLKAMSSFKPHEAIVRGFGQDLSEVEIIPSAVKTPLCILHGKLEQRRIERGIQQIKISISHSEQYAIAVAICL